MKLRFLLLFLSTLADVYLKTHSLVQWYKPIRLKLRAKETYQWIVRILWKGTTYKAVLRM
ncbi:Hypothetical protein I595_369 [Croceitalea dokdonensis DOKDO 023]|uniref:Uncharacterized protein n=1 Tax=Croceitalea dokdonensis DOKDO 023 TaxID=1300341 RepID=A0A0P7B465_9FLAO|nr:Hypothetical protein I595_369 [Croceitalea dokdonensis DOKDO 023]